MASTAELEAVLRLKDEFSPAMQRAAMAMTGMQEAALKTNATIGQSKGIFDGFGASLMSGMGIGAGFSIAAKGADLLFGALGSLQAGIGAVISGAVSAVTGFVGMSGSLTDMSARTGVSVTALQELKYAGSLVGVSLDDAAGAMGKMQKGISDGSAAFERLGLNLKDLQSGSPEQAFQKIGEAIARLPPGFQQTSAAMDIFGKSGASVLPLLQGNFADLAAEARALGIVLSEEDVAAADDLGDAATKLEAAWQGVKDQFAATVVESGALQGATDTLTEAAANLSKTVKDNRALFTVLFDGLEGAAVTGLTVLKRVAEGVLVLAEAAAGPVMALAFAGMAQRVKLSFDQQIAAVKGMQKATDEHAAYLRRVKDPMQKILDEVYAPPKDGYISTKAAAAADKAGATVKAAQEKIRLEAEKFAKTDAAASYKSLVDELNKMKAEEVNEAADALKRLTDEAKKLREESEAANLAQRLEDGRVAADELTTSYNNAADEAAALKEANKDAMRGLADSLREVGGMIGGTFGGLVSVAGDLITNLTDATEEGDKFKAVLGAIGAAGSVMGNSTVPIVAKLGGALEGAVKGFKLGAQAGMLFGPVGAVVGGAIGAIGGAIFGFLGKAKKLREEMDKLRNAFLDSVGGLEALKIRAAEAGVSIDEMMAAKNKATLLAAIDEIKQKLATWDEAQEKLNAAVEKYGFTIEELGPKFQQQKLDEMAGGLLEDFALLAASGIDVGTIISRMGPALMDFVNTSVAAGVAMPKAMQPLIEKLFVSGQLLHENGEAFTQAEYDGLSFTESLTEGLSRAITAIEALVAALTGVANVHVPTIVVPFERRDVTPGGGGGGDSERQQSQAMNSTRGVFGPVAAASSSSSSSASAGVDLGAILHALEQQPYAMARALKHALQTS